MSTSDSTARENCKNHPYGAGGATYEDEDVYALLHRTQRVQVRKR